MVGDIRETMSSTRSLKDGQGMDSKHSIRGRKMKVESKE
jgi:hypothetical protein